MSRGMKIFLGIVAGFIIVVTTFFYISLYGVPFKKSSIAKTIQKHLEEKYEEDVGLVGAIYNFKDGKYGGVYTIDDIEFYAEEGYDDPKKYIDTYPNEIWALQLKEDFKDVYKELFPRAIELHTNFVYSYEPEVAGPEIPRYDTVDSMLMLDLDIDEPFTNSDEQWEAITEIVKTIQEKSPHITSSFSFIEEDKNQETFIPCPERAEHEVASVEDAKKHCDKSVFDIEE